MHRINCFCFSMNRPLQLDGYLRSTQRFLNPAPIITVLFRATEQVFLEGYKQLAALHPDVTFLPQSDFPGQLFHWLNQASPHVMFGCDDVVFHQKTDMAAALSTLEGDPDLLACSLRLGENIQNSQSSPAPIAHPAFDTRDHFISWNWRKADGHWNYPFELDGSIYRREFIMHLLGALEMQRRHLPQAEWRHPNLLELRGNEWLKRNRDAPARMCCFRESRLIVPTVNRVQDLFPNPLLGEAFTPHQLETLRLQGKRLDLDAYHDKTYDRIHIGDFLLQ